MPGWSCLLGVPVSNLGKLARVCFLSLVLDDSNSCGSAFEPARLPVLCQRNDQIRRPARQRAKFA